MTYGAMDALRIAVQHDVERRKQNARALLQNPAHLRFGFSLLDVLIDGWRETAHL